MIIGIGDKFWLQAIDGEVSELGESEIVDWIIFDESKREQLNRFIKKHIGDVEDIDKIDGVILVKKSQGEI